MGSNSGSADERKGGSRSRSSRTNASTAGQSSSDSSGQVANVQACDGWEAAIDMYVLE